MYEKITYNQLMKEIEKVQDVISKRAFAGLEEVSYLKMYDSEMNHHIELHTRLYVLKMRLQLGAYYSQPGDSSPRNRKWNEKLENEMKGGE